MLGKTEAARFWILRKEMYANKNVLGFLNLRCLKWMRPRQPFVTVSSLRGLHSGRISVNIVNAKDEFISLLADLTGRNVFGWQENPGFNRAHSLYFDIFCGYMYNMKETWKYWFIC